MYTLYTIGHSYNAPEQFCKMLTSFGIELLVDVRSRPRSRFRHYGQRSVAKLAKEAGASYQWHLALGGFQTAPDHDPSNLGIEGKAFQSYADYMQTDAYNDGVNLLRGLTRDYRVAIMCAEASYIRCHRRMIADTVTAWGDSVSHIINPGECTPHILTPSVRFDRQIPYYPGLFQ